MNKPFLPEGYQVPKNMNGGGYMKFVDGQNKFRILSEAVTGYEVWTTDNKPIRYRDYPKSMPSNIREDTKIKHFWAFCVWNYATEQVEILEITQSSIRDAIHDIYKLEEYGEPIGYDIVVTRRGEGLDTEYSVQAMPPKPMAGNIQAAMESKKINLDALFDGGNPFAESEEDADVAYDNIGSMPPAPKSIRR